MKFRTFSYKLMCLALKLAIYLSKSTQKYWSFQLIYLKIGLIRCQQLHICWTLKAIAFVCSSQRLPACTIFWLVTQQRCKYCKTNDSTQHVLCLCVHALIHCNSSTIKLSSDYNECTVQSLFLTNNFISFSP